MIPQYIRFYGYTSSEVLNEYTRAFFTLVNSMLELKARESLDGIMVHQLADNPDSSTIDSLRKQSRGIGGIIREVETVKNIRGKK